MYWSSAAVGAPTGVGKGVWQANPGQVNEGAHRAIPPRAGAVPLGAAFAGHISRRGARPGSDVDGAGKGKRLAVRTSARSRWSSAGMVLWGRGWGTRGFGASARGGSSELLPAAIQDPKICSDDDEMGGTWVVVVVSTVGRFLQQEGTRFLQQEGTREPE